MDEETQNNITEEPKNGGPHEDGHEDSAATFEAASFSLTREAAAELFRKAGFPRSTRQISRWCKEGELVAVKRPTRNGLEAYIINEDSIRTKIAALEEEKRALENPYYEAVRPRDRARTTLPAPYDPEEVHGLRAENKVLKQQLGERDRMVVSMMDRLQKAHTELGSAQAQLTHREEEIKRLSAPPPAAEQGQTKKAPFWRRMLGG